MMKSALARIDFMVTNTLHPENLTRHKLTEADLENYIELTKEAQSQIRIYLREQFFSDQEEKRLELFVQRCQVSVIQFIDTLFDYSNHPVIPAIKKVYQSLIQIFEELLNFIQYRFAAYFNLDAKVPMGYKNICEAEFKTQMDLFSYNIKKHKVDKNLLKIIVQSFESFYKPNATKDLTFRRLIYLKKLLNSLIEKTKPRKIDNIDHQILVFLLYFNFNHLRIFSFITKVISADLNELAGNGQVIEKIHWYIKELHQLPLKPQLALYPELRLLKNFAFHGLRTN